MDRISVLRSHLLPASAGAAQQQSLVLSPKPVTPADIIFGCGPITPKYGGPEQAVVNAAVDMALANGIVSFDTAPLYGDSEDVLGTALQASPRAGEAVVMTKAGKLVRRRDPGTSILSLVPPADWTTLPSEDRVLLPDYSMAGAFTSFRESMQRLGGGMQHCHTLRIHDPDSVEGALAEAVGPDGLVAGLVQLRSLGLIQHVSFGMNANKGHMIVTPGAAGAETTPWPGPSYIIDNLIRAVPSGTFDSCLLACEHHLPSQLHHAECERELA